jgi:hypothetical protein
VAIDRVALIQHVRSFVPGERPAAMYEGEIFFNFGDKIMLVGDGGAVDDLLPIGIGGSFFSELFPNLISFSPVKANGTNNDAVPLAAFAATVPSIHFDRGVVRIATAMTISKPIKVSPGARIRIDGVVLTVNADVEAIPYVIFECVNGGSVVFTEKGPRASHVEWWGAIVSTSPSVNDGASPAANAVAINAAIQSAPPQGMIIYMQPGFYWVDDTIRLNKKKVELIGQGYQSTYLWHTTNDKTMVLIGTDVATAPSTYPNFDNIRMTDISAQRASGTAMFNADFLLGSKGIHIQGTVRVILTRVGSVFSQSCYYWTRTTNFTPIDCSAVSTPTTGQTAYLWMCDCRPDPLTDVLLAGQSSNASTKSSGCTASANNSAAGAGTSIALAVYGPWSDQFFEDFESAACDYGMDINGLDGTNNPIRVDLMFYNPVFDGVKIAAHRWGQMGTRSSARIVGGWTAFLGSAVGPVAVEMNAAFNVTYTAHEVTGWTNATCIGLKLDANSTGIMFGNTNLLSDLFSPVIVNAANLCDISPCITGYAGTKATAQAAIAIYAGARNKFEPFIHGVTGAFGNGIVGVAAAPTHSEFNLTGISPGALVASKLLLNGVAIPTRGDYGTANYVTGVMT